MNNRGILNITIQNGKFAGTSGAEVNSFKEDYIEGNGWTCRCFSDGSIKCKAYLSREGEEENSIIFRISKCGYINYLEIRDGVKIERRKSKLKEWPTNGVIGLSDGNIDDRYAFFQNEEYRKFLNEYHVRTVKREEPNHTYTIYRCFSQEEDINVEEILWSDGNIAETGINSGRTEAWDEIYPGTFSFEKYSILKVTDATWVMIDKVNHKKDISDKKIYTMLEIPELREALKEWKNKADNPKREE